MNEELLEREDKALAELGAVIGARARVIRRIVQDRFPEYPVIVRSSSDIWGLCVDVFNVPDQETRDRIEESIMGLDRDKDIVGNFFTLAMVHSIEVTRQYYPEFADKKGNDPCLPQQ